MLCEIKLLCHTERCPGSWRLGSYFPKLDVFIAAWDRDKAVRSGGKWGKMIKTNRREAG